MDINKNDVTLIISGETIKTAFEDHLNKILIAGQYDNPIKKSIDNLIGYNGDKDLKELIDNKVKNLIIDFIDTPEFKTAVGNSMADHIAKRAMENMKK